MESHQSEKKVSHKASQQLPFCNKEVKIDSFSIKFLPKAADVKRTGIFFQKVLGNFFNWEIYLMEKKMNQLFRYDKTCCQYFETLIT